MATVIDNAKEKTMLLEAFRECTKEISLCLDAAAGDIDMERIVDEVGKRDGIINEINMINGLLERLDTEDAEIQSELGKESQLWFALMDEIQQMEAQNGKVMLHLQNNYMQKVKSSKDAIKVINAYTKQMADGEAVNVDKSK